MLLFVAHVMEKYPTRDGKLAFVTQLDNIIYDTRLNLTMPRGLDHSVTWLRHGLGAP
jgi:hypothetical protein